MEILASDLKKDMMVIDSKGKGILTVANVVNASRPQRTIVFYVAIEQATTYAPGTTVTILD